ncbi:MAG: hypothetical protein EOM05_05410 [Clostridia bacterium]|nr:hypothetical protein [Clostridia bacterium]
MMLEELKKKRTVQLAFAVIYMILSSVFVPISTVHMQKNNAISAQVIVTQPETTKEQTTQPTTTEVTTTEAPVPEPTVVKLACSSVQNDLKIKLLDSKTSKYVLGVAFTVNVTDKAGKKTTYTNKDLKGLIYVTNITAGQYSVKLDALEGFDVSVDNAKVLVKNKVERKAITDINEKVNKTANVKEDSKVPQDMVQEKTLINTVDFVQSTPTKIPSQTTYVLVAFENIRVPGTTETTSGETTAAETTSTTSNELSDTNGNKLYIKNNDTYIIATIGDYSQSTQFYKQEITPETYKYTGWQTIDGKRYYYDKNGVFVTGNQVINGAKYSFSNEGVLAASYGVLGIDVSKYQYNIDWNAVKASGVQFAIIRAGYRGWGSTGSLNKDPYFDKNIKGASAAGIDIGIYYFSQAINEVEAVEEASQCIDLVKGYKIKYPIFIDTETSGGNGSGRADGLSKAQRTIVCKTFCETIQNSGYMAGIYTSKSWFETKLNTSQLEQYVIWLAQWTDKPTYTGKYDVWQYSSKGQVAGISGNVDMNLSYMTF